jgi:hypothetical protein
VLLANFPTGQLVQLLARPVAIFPLGHEVQEPCAALLLYFPEGQDVQRALPTLEYMPAGQSEQPERPPDA